MDPDPRQRLVQRYTYYPEEAGASTSAQPTDHPNKQSGLEEQLLIQALDRMLTINQHSFMTRMDHMQESQEHQARMITLYYQETKALLDKVVCGLEENLEDRRQSGGMNYLITELDRIEHVLGTSRLDTDGSFMSIFDRLSAIEKAIQEIRDNPNVSNGNRPVNLIAQRDVGTSPHLPSVDLPEKVYVDTAVGSFPTSTVSRDTNTEPENLHKDIDLQPASPVPPSSAQDNDEFLDMHLWNFDHNRYTYTPETTYKSSFDVPDYVPVRLVPAQWSSPPDSAQGSSPPVPAAIDTSIIFAAYKPNDQTASEKESSSQSLQSLQSLQPSPSLPTVSGFDLDRSMSPLSSLSTTSEDIPQSYTETATNRTASLKRNKHMSSSAPPRKRSRTRVSTGSHPVSLSELAKNVTPPAHSDKQYIQCDVCLSWFHYGCVGIVENDPRLDEDATFECPRCQSSGSDPANADTKIGQQDLSCICNQNGPNEYFVERIIGKRMKKGGGGWQWLVKWEGYDYNESSWLEEADIGAHDKHLKVFLKAANDEGLDVDDDEDILLSKAAELAHLWKD